MYFQLVARDHLNDFIMLKKCSCQLDIRLSDWGVWGLRQLAQSPAVQGLIASALSRDAVKTPSVKSSIDRAFSHTHSSTSLSSLIPT